MPNNEEKPRVASALVKKLIVGMLFSIVLMGLGAGGVLSGLLPESALTAVPAASGLVGALWLGRAAARVFGGRAVMCGLASGAAFFAVLFFLGALFYLRWAPDPAAAGMLAACLTGGLVGGLLAVPRGRGRKPQHTYETRRNRT
ncbi:MAG: hypothetical protein LBT60_01215 [Oscillospiraceae bacterium]|jgi:uncharacterized membrane protein|nr:hypothetical protein [Oscillospiraceae bacterium]